MLLNKWFKYIFIFLIILIPFDVFSLVSKSSDVFVTDEAKMLSKYTKEYIITYSSFFNTNNDIDYYVVCVKSFEDMEEDEYIDYVYDSFNISKKGILILASSDDRLLKIKVGEELSGVITDDIISEYIDLYFMPYLKQGEWDLGIRNGYSAFYKLLCNYYDIDSSPMSVYTGKNVLDKYKFPISTFIIFICSLLSYRMCISFDKNKKFNSMILLFLLINISLILFLYTFSPISVLVAFVFEIFSFIDIFYLKKINRK